MFELSTEACNIKELREGDYSAFDAIYLGDYSCPEYPNNFTSNVDQLQAGLDLVKSRKQKCYLRLYAVPSNHDLPWVEDLIDAAIKMPFDGFEVHNLGLLRMLKKKGSTIPVHLGVFGNLYTHETAKTLKEYNVTRVCPNPELSLKEIAYIAENTPIDTIVAVHGKIPLVISETCFIVEHSEDGCNNPDEPCNYQCASEHWLKRGRNDGSHTDWSLKDTGRMTLSGKDLCMLEHAETLVDMGFNSFYVQSKGEGKDYVGKVGSIYRAALEKAFDGEAEADYAPMVANLNALSREGLCNGYYFESAGQRYFGRA